MNQQNNHFIPSFEDCKKFAENSKEKSIMADWRNKRARIIEIVSFAGDKIFIIPDHDPMTIKRVVNLYWFKIVICKPTKFREVKP